MCRLLGKIAHYVVITSVVIIGVIVSQPVAAQVTTGSISGTVTDATGAIIPGASVAIRNVGTDLTRSVNADASGFYQAADLPVGPYEIIVQQKGFATVKKVGIDLTVGAALVENVSLTVGATTEVVQVQATAVQVEAASSEVGALVGEKQMVDLPLNGRDYAQLILLAPGMQPVTNMSTSSMTGRASTFAAAGSRPQGQAILLDGTDIQGFYQHGSGSTMLGTSLGVEGIAEFKTLTNTYSAEFGGEGTAINMVTKGGTNQFHGSAYDYLRNSVFDARNYFDPLSGPPSFRRNQFGGSVGGPVKKDSTFFFVNYEGYRQALGETVVSFVPDQNAHNMQLPCSALSGAPFTAECASVPSTTLETVTSSNPSATAGLLSYYPTTGLGAEAGNGTAYYTAVGQRPINENYLLARGDQKLGAKDNFFVRLVRDQGTYVEPFPLFTAAATGGGVTGWPESDYGTQYYVTLQENRSITNNLINVFRFSFVRTQQVGSTTTKGGVLDNFPGRGEADVSTAGIGTIGSGSRLPILLVQNKLPVEDQVYWTHGAHDVRFGGSFAHWQSNDFALASYNGSWTFNSLQLMLQNTAFSVSGNPVGYANGHKGYDEWHYYGYFEDNWKVRQNLTLNLGVRYEPMSNPTGNSGTVLEAVVNPLTATGNGYTPVSNVFQSNVTLKDFDPRIGLAYTPFGPKTVIHSGFAIYHEDTTAWIYGSMYNGGPPGVLTYTQQNPTFPNAFVGGGAPPKTSMTGAGTAYVVPHAPYVMQWNLNIERDLGRGLIASAGYIGTRSNHLYSYDNLNPAEYTLNSSGQPVFNGILVNSALSYITVDVPTAEAHYNGLQVTLKGQVAHSIQLQLNYAWSKALSDEDSSSPSITASGSTGQVNPYDIGYDEGTSSFNMTQVFSGSVLYDLPLHKNAWVSGWEWGLMPQAHSGMPYTTDIGYDFSKLLGNSSSERPDLVGNFNVAGPVAANPSCSAPASIHNAHNWYNPCAFVLPGGSAANLIPGAGFGGAPGTLGDIRRNALVSPGYLGLDTSLSKTTALTERLRMQLRFEAFNFINHTNFSTPGENLFSAGSKGLPLSSDGAITSTVGTSRQLQFSLKFLF